MPAAAPPEPYWDPYDVEVDFDPYDTWRQLRDEAPVYRNERYDFWALSRFEDVAWASRRPERFISGHGTVLEIMGPDLVRPGLIIFMDPPEHTAFRALVSRAFTPRRVAELEGRIRQVCNDLLDAQRGSGGFDYVVDFGAQLPSLIISELLGVPGEDRVEVLGLIDRMFHIEPGVGMVNDISLSASIALHQFLAGELEQRRRRPRPDLLTALTEVEVDVDEGNRRRRLSEAEAAGFANLLVSAGTETVGKLLGWAAVVLGQYGAERRRLAQEPELIPAAVEELLRYEAPSPVQARRCVQETELHGAVIPEGAKVVLLTGSAGRDERRYEDADRFRLDRTDTHLSFGVGVHFCLGAALARLEGRIALEETLRRFPDWEVDRAGVERMHTSTVRGHSRVPIRVG
jgi:cytochrome P450